MSGLQLINRIEMEEAELIDALEGLIALGYLQGNRLGFRDMAEVKSASFRVTQNNHSELRDAVYPSRKKDEKGRRRRRT